MQNVAGKTNGEVTVYHKSCICSPFDTFQCQCRSSLLFCNAGEIRGETLSTNSNFHHILQNDFQILRLEIRDINVIITKEISITF